MAGDFHIDMSGKLYEKVIVGIACVNGSTGKHNGCVLRPTLIDRIKHDLFIDDIQTEHAKLYAICIHILIKERIPEIGTGDIVICNDEDFSQVMGYLYVLLKRDLRITHIPFDIINITKLKQLSNNRNMKSLADSYANSYRKRGLNRTRHSVGKELDVVRLDFSTIRTYWHILD